MEEKYEDSISARLRLARLARDLKQSDVDEGANLPANTFSKVERNKRELTMSEFLRVTQFLCVSVDAILSNEGPFIYREEKKIVEALRTIPFDDYKRILHTIEAKVYYANKDAPDESKPHMMALVETLSRLRHSDQRPRTDFSEIKRVRS